MFRKSDTWLTSRLSHRPSEPVYKLSHFYYHSSTLTVCMQEGGAIDRAKAKGFAKFAAIIVPMKKLTYATAEQRVQSYSFLFPKHYP